MEIINVLILNKCLKYIFEYLEYKFPYIEELEDTTTRIYDFIYENIFYDNKCIIRWNNRNISTTIGNYHIDKGLYFWTITD
jgi:hypothetical protein